MKTYLLEDLKVLKQTLVNCNADLTKNFGRAVNVMVKALTGGNKILVCGNGGSAADAEHMAGEIVGRFGYDRASLPCVALCTPSATFTAIANDYGYSEVFARQVAGLGVSNDVLLGISTSGNSENIVKAVLQAKQKNITTVVLTGAKDSALSKVADIVLRSPSVFTPRIQEIHGLIIHSLCRAIEEEIFTENKAEGTLPFDKFITNEKLKDFAKLLKGYNTVFTNGCFDILHPGHVYLLNKARALGDLLILGLNTDSSIKRIKGENRPYHKFSDRVNVLSALEPVDYIIGFDEDTPKRLIDTLIPKILVKGGDYTEDNVVGAEIVKKNGGKVVIIETLKGHSTTGILNDKNK